MQLTFFILLAGIANYSAIVYLSHALDTDTFSKVIYITGISTLAAYISLLGFHAQALEDAHVKSKNINILPLFISLALFLISTFAISKIQPNWSTSELFLYFSFGLATIISEYVCIRLRLLRRYAFYAIISKPILIFYLALFCFLSISDFSEHLITISAAATLIINCIVSFFFLGSKTHTSISAAIDNWSRAKDYYFFTFLFCLNLQLGPIILNQIGESNQIAEFSIAFIVVNASNLIVNSYFGVARQELFYIALQDSPERAIDIIREGLRLAIIFSIALSVISYLVINNTYQYVFDINKFPNIIFLSNIALASIPIRIIHVALSPLMSSARHIRAKNFYLCVAYISGWAISYLFAPRLGPAGLFLGLILTEFITATGYLVTSFKGERLLERRRW